MAVTGLAGTLGNYANMGTKKSSAKSTLDMDSFMKLMAVQMQNQDMSSPMDNSAMMAQLTQMASVQAMNTFTELSVTQYAMGMMGQEVKVAYTGSDGKIQYKTGKVSGIALSSKTPSIFLEGDSMAYSTSNLMQVGKIPEKEDITIENGDNSSDKDSADKDSSDKETPDAKAAANGPSGADGRSASSGRTSESAAKSAAYINSLPEDKATYYDNGSMPADKAASLADSEQKIPADKAAYMAGSYPAKNSVPSSKSSEKEGYGPGYLI